MYNTVATNFYDRYTKTYWWDISDLTNPELKSIFYSSETSIDHNQYIVGDYTFQVRFF